MSKVKDSKKYVKQYQPKEASVAILTLDRVNSLTRSFTTHKWRYFINTKVPVKLQGMAVLNV